LEFVEQDGIQIAEQPIVIGTRSCGSVTMTALAWWKDAFVETANRGIRTRRTSCRDFVDGALAVLLAVLSPCTKRSSQNEIKVLIQ
jgi:hypothetical protein